MQKCDGFIEWDLNVEPLTMANLEMAQCMSTTEKVSIRMINISPQNIRTIFQSFEMYYGIGEKVERVISKIEGLFLYMQEKEANSGKA